MSRLIEESVAEVRRKGEIEAIKKRLDDLMVIFTRNWKVAQSSNQYATLEQALTRTDRIVSKMRELLAALQELETGGV